MLAFAAGVVVPVGGFFLGAGTGSVVSRILMKVLGDQAVASDVGTMVFMLIAATSLVYAIDIGGRIYRHGQGGIEPVPPRKVVLMYQFGVIYGMLLWGGANAVLNKEAPMRARLSMVLVAFIWGAVISIDLGPRLARMWLRNHRSKK